MFRASCLEQTVFIDFTMAESSARKSTRLRKREIEFIGRKMLSIDLEIMGAFVIRQVNEVEHHMACTCYPLRKMLWTHLKEVGIKQVVEYFLETFCQLRYSPVTTSHTRDLSRVVPRVI